MNGTEITVGGNVYRTLEAQVYNNKERLDSLDIETLEDLPGEFTELSGSVDDLAGDVEGLTTRMESAEGNILDLDQDINGTGGIDDRLDAAEENISSSAGDISQLQYDLGEAQGDITALGTSKLDAPTAAGNVGDVIVKAASGTEWQAVAPFNPNGTYPGVTVGNATEAKAIAAVSDNSGSTQTDPFFMQGTGTENNTGSTPTGKVAELREIRGNTICYNQLVDGVNLTYQTISGHKYWCYISATDYTSIVTSSGSNITVSSAQNDLIVDLTLLFNGNANIPQEILDDALMFPGNYWNSGMAYSAGILVDTDIDSLVTVEFNQWDEEWELGLIDESTGANTSSSTIIRSKNYIPVIPNTNYYFGSPNYNVSTDGIYIFCYDSNKSYLGFSTGGYIMQTNPLFTTPKDCRYIRFRLNSSYGTTYNHDICINLSWDAQHDGEYKPYVSHTYPISFSGKSAGSAYDSLAPDGTKTTRIGSVDLGSLTWILYHHGTLGDFFYASASTLGMKYIGSYSDNVYPIVNSKYVAVKRTQLTFVDKSITCDGDSTAVLQLQIKDSDYADGASLKTALNGVYLYYELATPTTSTETAFTSTIEIDDYGTMRFEKSNAIVSVPVGNEIFYPADYVLLLDDLNNYVNGDVTDLVKFSEFPIPAPTGLADGTYKLVATISGGVATLSWEAEL